MSVKLSKKDYIWSYIGVILSLSANIIMVPVIMHYLDGDHYGIWGIFQNLAGITTLFDFGFATTFGRNINYCWNGAERLEKTGGVISNTSEPNFYLMKKTMTACQRIFILISGTALLLMVTIGTAYVDHVSKPLNSSEPVIAWNIYAIAIFLNLYYGYYNAFLRGVGAIQEVNKAMVYARGTQIIATVVLLATGFGLIGTGIAYLMYGFLFRLLAKRSFYHYKGIGEGIRNVQDRISRSEIKEMFFIVWHNAWREGLVSLSNYLATQASTVIVSLYMPLTQTGAYALGVQLTNAVGQIAGAMYRSNQPVLQSAYISNDKHKQRSTMSLIVVSYMGLDLVGLFLVTVIGLPLLRLVRPETVVPTIVLLAMGIYQMILNFRDCYGSYFSCTNRIPYAFPYLITSLCSVLLAAFAMGILHMGMWGIIGAQIICQCAYNVWHWALRAHREMELSPREMIRLGTEEMKRVSRDMISLRRKEET